MNNMNNKLTNNSAQDFSNFFKFTMALAIVGAIF